MKTNTPKKSITIKILLLLLLVSPLVQSQDSVPTISGILQDQQITIQNAPVISNGATRTSQTRMPETVIYQATATNVSPLGISISAPTKEDATRFGDVVTLGGTNRLLTNITVALFHNSGDAFQPVTLYVSIFDECASTGVSGSPCTEENNLILEGSITYTPPISGAYNVSLNIDPTLAEANLYPADNELTVMFHAVSNANVFMVGNVPVTTGADPFPENGGGVTLCGTNITSSGCNLVVPDWDFNNLVFSLSAIADTNPPTAICKNITVTLPDDAVSIVPVPASAINDGSFDPEGGDLSFFIGESGFTTDILLSCASIGANPVTLRVVDEAGNESTCTATVTVERSLIEFNTGSCLPVTLIANCDAGIFYTPPIVTATQSCETVTVTQINGPVGSSFLPLGPTVFSYRALSSSGEERFCSSIVTVVPDSFDIVYVDAASTGTEDGSSWANAFTDLQPAIDLATSCANVTEIRVASGTYLPTENPDGTTTTSTNRNNAFHVDTDINIKGSYNPNTNTQDYNNPSMLSGDFNGNDVITGVGASLTIANNSENAYHVLITTDLSNSAVIDGFIIKGGNADGGFAIDYSGESIFAGYGGGMLNIESSPDLRNIVLHGNSADLTGGGMYNLSNSSLLTNTVFTFNSAQLGGGMYNDSSSPSIINGTFYGNFASANGGGIRNIVNTSPTIIENTVLYGNSTDIENSASGSVSGTNNFSENFVQTGFTAVMADPFTNSADPDGTDNLLGTLDDGLVPGLGSPLIDAGNSSLNTLTTDITGQARINESAIDVGAYERTPCAVFESIMYVDASVSGGIGDGSSWANAFTDLQPALDLATSCVNVTEIRVASGTYFPTERPVGGNTTPTNRDNAFHLDIDIILKGSYNPNTDTQEYNNPSILSGDYNGNDVITGSGTTLTITGNDENAYNVFITANLSNATIIDGFTIKGGNANLVQGYVYSNNVLFFRNNGGGFQNRQSSPSLTNMVITGNSARGGGGMLNGNNASPLLTNIVFAFNSANFGGGISNGASLIITNATFYGNRATSAGGGLGDSSTSSSNLNNTVFYGNTTDIDNTSSSGSIIGANNFSEDFTGAGFTLLTADPFSNSADPDGVDNLFGTPDDGLVPAAGSVLIDAGDSSLNTEATDVTGNIRIRNSAIDVGAYENPNTFCSMTTTYTIVGGWDNGLPSSSAIAVIAENYNTATTGLGDITACELIINTGATLTVAAGHFVSVENDITVNGTLDILHTGSLVQVQEDAVTVNNGTINVSKITPTIDDRNFVAMSSPVTAEARDRVYGNSRAVFSIIPQNFVPFVIDFGIFPEFEFAENFLDDNGDYLLPVTGSTTTPPAGIGQLVFPQPEPNVGDGSYTLTYTQNPSHPGTLNSGTISVPINYNGPATTNNYNLLGNPYASAIDVTAFINANDAVNEVYYWDHITNPTSDLPGFGTSNFSMNDVSLRNAMMGIAAVNGGSAPGQFMASGQGFGIKADQAEMMDGTPVVFTNSIRVTGNNDGFRNSDTQTAIDKLWLNLTTPSFDEAIAQTGIGFTAMASPEIDKGYDSPRVGTFLSLFTTLDSGELLGIQTREAFDTDIEIALGFSTSIEEETSYTISIAAFEGMVIENNSVFIIDHLLSTIVNLKEESYTFTAQKGLHTDRFMVVFQDRDVLSVDGDSFRESGINIYPNPSQGQVTLAYKGSSTLENAVITDINGKIIKRIDLQNFDQIQTMDLGGLATGMYFMQITSQENTFIKKIMIR